MSSPLCERIAQEHAAAEESLPSGVVARPRRRRAIAALLASGLPTPRDENWRYANLRPLERARFAPVAERLGLRPGELPPALPGYSRYVYVDGVFARDLSAAAQPLAGVTVRALSGGATAMMSVEGPEDAESRSRALRERDSRADPAFGLLNEAFALDGAEIRVASAAPRSRATPATPACIEIVFVAQAPAEEGATYPRLEVVTEKGARLSLIERHFSLTADATLGVGSVDLRVDEEAFVEHYRIQQLAARAVWLDTLSATVGLSGSYRLHAFALGAQAARSTLHVALEGDGAALAQHAVAAGDRQQVLDSYTVVEHAAARTRTEQSFRGIAAGRARVAFNGKIIVRPGARGADSNQSLRGLLAGPEAEIDVRPQLEIYTDEVRCSHGATAGKLDENMLFYLLSRGLARETAQRLLKWAFLEDVVSKVEVPQLRRQVEESLAGRVQHVEVLKEFL
ncbi:MAG TPA: SufD family Fe-S cluster assembly protein [Steroidobacteraceae bacterium]|nr:SufD family Fe-S cluster assembly protein [Steroidobacteraceae bacterium]